MSPQQLCVSPSSSSSSSSSSFSPSFHCYSLTPSCSCIRLDLQQYELQSSTISSLCIFPSIALPSSTTLSSPSTFQPNEEVLFLFQSDRCFKGSIGIISFPDCKESSFQSVIQFHLDQQATCQMKLNMEKQTIELVLLILFMTMIMDWIIV